MNNQAVGMLFLQVTSRTSEHIFQTLNDQDLQSWVDVLQTTTVEMLKNCPQELLIQQQRREGGNAVVMQDGSKKSVGSPNTGERGSHVTWMLADGYEHERHAVRNPFLLCLYTRPEVARKMVKEM